MKIVRVVGLLIGSWPLLAAAQPGVMPIADVVSPVPRSAESIDSTQQLINQSRQLAESRRYEEALQLLMEALRQEPNNLDMQLAIVRVLSWQGRYAEAEDRLSRLNPQQSQAPDALQVRGYLAYYQGHYVQAGALFQQLLALEPGDTDARAALALIEQAQQAQQKDEHPWQWDMGYENSQFSRRPQPDWEQQFGQLSHVSPSHDRAWYGKLVRWQQFGQTDYEVESGFSQRFGDDWYASTTLGYTDAADFRPKNRLEVGIGYRLLGRDGNSWPLWMSLDGATSQYQNLRVNTLKLGARLEPSKHWGLLLRTIRVQPEGENTDIGYELRTDWQVFETLRWVGGIAQAPDTQAGETINTTSWYSNLAWQASPHYTWRIGYSRDDRDNAYIKRTWNLSLGYRY